MTTAAIITTYRFQNGALIGELFTRDGAGLIISRDLYEGIRMAKERDIHMILSLIQPFVVEGAILSRSYDQIDKSIEDWVVVERDGNLIACSSLVMYENNMAELACVCVMAKSKHTGTGN